MKKFLIVFLSSVILIGVANVYAYEYQFETGADKSSFGKSTSNDDPVPVDHQTTNVRRNKDAAYFAPVYGIFSGEIQTSPTNIYYNNSNSSYATNTGGSFNSNNTSNSNSDFNSPDTIMPSTSISGANGTTSVLNTTPLMYDDGSIGTLHIHKVNKTLKVYEGESLANMEKGIGHFEITSAWDGKVSFAGHNRGAAGYFSFVKDLQVGDKITYTTKYGVRSYEVFIKEQINETDYTSLGWTAENIITMITCVENQPSLRWSVQAREVR